MINYMIRRRKNYKLMSGRYNDIQKTFKIKFKSTVADDVQRHGNSPGLS